MRNRLLQLFKDNRGVKARVPLAVTVMQPQAGADAPSEATIYVYDVIVGDELEAEFWGGVCPAAFIKALASAVQSAETVHIRFNSPGGDVFAARAMEAAIRGCSKRVIAHVDGLAASAATYVALACDEVEIASGAFFMIHKAWTGAWGNEDDHLYVAGLLGKIDETLVDTYVRETGLEADMLRGLIAAETWLNAQEAVDLGFADRIMEDAPKVSGAWNLSAYKNAPMPASEDGAAGLASPEPGTESQEPDSIGPEPDAGAQGGVPHGETGALSSGEQPVVADVSAAALVARRVLDARLRGCEAGRR